MPFLLQMTLKHRRIMFFPQELLSHYLRCICLARQLKDDYEIVFFTSETYACFVEKEGFLCIMNDLSDISEVLRHARQFDFSWINRDSIEAGYTKQFSVIMQQKPDMVVGDANLSLRMAAQKAGVPMVALQNNYLSKYYADIRPVPHQHPANAFKPKLSEKNWNRLVRSVEKIVLRSVHRPFRILRSEYRLPRFQNLLDEFAGDYVLYLDNELLFPLRSQSSNALVIGPMAYHSNQDEPELLSWLNSCNPKPLVYVSMGSSGNAENLGFLHHPAAADYNWIVTGSSDTPRANIFFKPFVNFDVIARKVQLMVCHGGNGTIYQALMNEIPLIMMPSFFEQEWNTHRIVKLGLGVVFYPENPVEEFYEICAKQLLTKNDPARIAMANQLQQAKYTSVKDFFESIP